MPGLRAQRQKAKAETGLGIFITHNTNFPCLTHFASSNEIIDRYKNKDSGEGGLPPPHPSRPSPGEIMLRVGKTKTKAEEE